MQPTQCDIVGLSTAYFWLALAEGMRTVVPARGLDEHATHIDAILRLLTAVTLLMCVVGSKGYDELCRM